MLRPLADRVIIKKKEKRESTKSGIILAGNIKEETQFAEVLEVGPGTEKIKMEVKKQDKVIISQNIGVQVRYENEDLIIINQSDILAIVD